jgi:hypothetical protein
MPTRNRTVRSKRPAAASVSFETRVLDSWDAYLRVITDPPFANWSFRGQANAAWPLSSTLTRYFTTFQISQADWNGRERRSLRIFKRKATHFLTHVPKADDDFEWLALMQHHGSPTRLLDFTKSPYVAAFFALERAEQDAAVWAADWSRMPSLTPVTRGEIRERAPSFTLRELQAGNVLAKGQIGFGEPYIMNRRLIAQSGTLAVPPVLGLPIEEILRSTRGALLKMILPRASVRPTAMHELYRMNITNATLFPDLDGLARSLAYELEGAPPQRRR